MTLKSLLVLSFLLLTTTCYAAVEDFSTYTETDPESRMTVTSTKITWSNWRTRAVTTGVNKDYGAGYFTGDLEHQFTLNCTSIDRYSIPLWYAVIDIASTDTNTDWNATDGIRMNSSAPDSDNAGTIRMKAEGGTLDTYTFSIPFTYYITVERTGTAATAKIYSDSGRTTLLDTLSDDNGKSGDLRYINTSNSYDTNSSGREVDGYLENLEFITEAAAGTGLTFY